jgi:phage-related protein
MLLRLLENGEYLGLPHSRPMSRIGSTCHELRLVDGGAAWRIVYGLQTDAILILAHWLPEDRATLDARQRER